MLDDRELMNDINPFVARDFSPPGSVRKMGDFKDFSREVETKGGVIEVERSVFCEDSLCRNQVEPIVCVKEVHPKYNVDHGFTVGVSDTHNTRYLLIASGIVVTFLALYIVVRK
mgnify:CR=1 FL=1